MTTGEKVAPLRYPTSYPVVKTVDKANKSNTKTLFCDVDDVIDIFTY